MSISLADIDAFIFDFDGVLTNNLVHLDNNGNEWVTCSRSDGLAFDTLRKLNQKVYILSTETNSVVAARAKKLQVPVIYGVADKVQSLEELASNENLNLKKVLYIGNDLNDFKVMQICGFSACPSDSHSKIQALAQIVLKSPGGQGVIRELLEDILGIAIEEILQ